MRGGLERILGQCATTLAAMLVFFLATGAATAQKAEIPLVVVTPVGAPQLLFDPAKQGCDANDIPDAPLRAYRLADGRIAAFGLHYENRRLVGARLEALKLECPVVFRGTGDANPAHLDDRIWIAATQTQDGKTIHALGHAEYHGEAHPGRCPYPENLKCLWVSVIGLTSRDGGAHFSRLPAPIAMPGITAAQEQGRHRGFFNPTNIVERGGAQYFMVAQTGWPGQDFGVCLFRTQNIASGQWRAWDGQGFGAAFPSPYAKTAASTPCAPLAPFPLVPGSITRHRTSGLWLALFPAGKGMPDHRGGSFDKGGFYVAASRDLVSWGAPTLVWETPFLGDDPCGAVVLRAYPVLIDAESNGRNFEETGDTPLLTYAQMPVQGCAIGHARTLLARKVRISVLGSH